MIWTARPEAGTGYYVAVFNTGESELKVDRAWKDTGLEERVYSTRDLWERKSLGKANRLKLTLAPHASALWKVE